MWLVAYATAMPLPADAAAAISESSLTSLSTKHVNDLIGLTGTDKGNGLRSTFLHFFLVRSMVDMAYSATIR